MQIDVIIPNFNGARLLSHYLPGVIERCGNAGVVVVDDASSDESLHLLEECYPQVRVVARKTNSGFSAAVNDGIKETNREFVVLFNNDIEVTPGFLDSIIPLFEDEAVFAVSPRIILPSKCRLDEGAKTGFWRHGIFYTDQRQEVESLSPVLYATGCAAVYRRSMLEQLGGFDEAYSPFYWEDADLGYRAWKRGWKSLYQPASTVYHQHSSSTSRMKRQYVDAVKARNGLLFVWRNIEDDGLRSMHRRWLPLVLARRALTGDTSFLRGWKMAWSRRSEARESRERDSAFRRISDRDIFETVGIKL